MSTRHFPTFTELDSFFRGPLFDTPQQPAFPPYDILQSKDGRYVKLAIAVAGFKQDAIEIKVVDNQLIVSGDHSQQNQQNDEWEVQHKGIASRKFMLRWHKNPKFEVKHAAMKDGLLSIVLERVEDPQIMIPIANDELFEIKPPQLLTEEAA